MGESLLGHLNVSDLLLGHLDRLEDTGGGIVERLGHGSVFEGAAHGDSSSDDLLAVDGGESDSILFGDDSFRLFVTGSHIIFLIIYKI